MALKTQDCELVHPMEERWEDKSQSTPIIDMGFFLFPSSLFFGQVIHALLIHKPSSCSAHTRKKKTEWNGKKNQFQLLDVQSAKFIMQMLSFHH